MFVLQWPSFRESFQDNGDTDAVAAMKALYDSGFRGVVRPDHVPTLDGESNDNPGYEMLGRLWALGYLKVRTDQSVVSRVQTWEKHMLDCAGLDGSCGTPGLHK
jgi:D-mannonate dehydratase